MRYPFVLYIVIGILASAVPVRAETVFGPFGRWTASVEASFEFSPLETDSTVYSLLSPIAQGGDWLLYTDLRAHNLHPDWHQANMGLVFRKRWNSAIYGAYGFIDVQNSAADNEFWQGTLGFEILTDRFDMRLRGTMPFDDAKSALGASAALIQNGNIIFYQGEENALESAELDVRMRLPVDQVFGERMGFWMGLDTAIYDHDNIDRQTVYGGRFEARLNDGVFGIDGSRLTLEAGLKKAEGFDPAFTGALRVRLPIGRAEGVYSEEMDWLDRRMTDRVHHAFYSPVLPLPTGPTEDVYDNATNVLINKYAELDNALLVVAQNANAGATAAENTLFVLNGDNGPLGGSLIIGDNRTYVGGGATIELRGGTTNTVVQFTAPGTTPDFGVTTGNPIVSIQGSNTHIAGLNLIGPGTSVAFNHGFGGTGLNGRITGVSNVVIEQNTIAGVGNDGIGFDQGNSQIVLRDNVILNAGADGIAFEINNTDVVIANNTINGAGAIGIALGSGNTNFQVVGNSVGNTTGSGFVMGAANVISDFSNNMFTGAIGGDLITISGGGSIINGAGNSAGTALIGGGLCGNGANAFTGLIGFIDAPLFPTGVVFQDNVAPCT